MYNTQITKNSLVAEFICEPRGFLMHRNGQLTSTLACRRTLSALASAYARWETLTRKDN